MEAGRKEGRKRMEEWWCGTVGRVATVSFFGVAVVFFRSGGEEEEEGDEIFPKAPTSKKKQPFQVTYFFYFSIYVFVFLI